jgi:uncharacterized membrane protein
MPLYLKLVFVFSVIGLLDTAYLIYHKVVGSDVYCLFFPKEWCRKVQHSKYSKTFGIPNSVAGLGMYIAIFVLSLMFYKGMLPSFFLPQFLIGFGFLFSLYFMYIQGFVLRAFCTWCVLSFVNFTVMAYAVFLLR